MTRTCCPCKRGRGRDVVRVNDELVICRCPCDHAAADTLPKTIARLASGKCTRCGQREPEPGKRRCTQCIADQKKWNAAKNKVERAQAEAVRAACMRAS